MNEIAQLVRHYAGRRSHRESKKNIFLISGIFLKKIDSVMLLGFKCTLNPQNLIKIVIAIFEKFEILNFLGVGGKLNNGSRHLQEDPRYRI